MRVLVLYAHPNPESFGAALHRAVVETLLRAGHEVDDCDLYAERFDPVLSCEERVNYLSIPDNCRGVEAYVERLRRAEALVLVFCVELRLPGHPQGLSRPRLPARREFPSRKRPRDAESLPPSRSWPRSPPTARRAGALSDR